jgi:hypothetical protein
VCYFNFRSLKICPYRWRSVEVDVEISTIARLLPPSWTVLGSRLIHHSSAAGPQLSQWTYRSRSFRRTTTLLPTKLMESMTTGDLGCLRLLATSPLRSQLAVVFGVTPFWLARTLDLLWELSGLIFPSQLASQPRILNCDQTD